MKRTLSIILALAMLLILAVPFAAYAEEPSNTFNGNPITFSDWSNAGFGGWKEDVGILKPTTLTEYNMLRFGTALGKNYTVDMDVRQLDTTSGWQTIQLGFDVAAGENFTQSGLVLDMHNAGVCRVITYKDRDKHDGTPGSYDNPYGGNGDYVASTDWFHITITRAGSNYTVKVAGTTLNFKTDGYNGGYLVLGSVGSREVNYKNVKITSNATEEVPENTFNGEQIPFSDWAFAGIGEWKEEKGILKPTEITEYNMLRFEKALGNDYTVDMDVRQLDTTSGWQTIQIGFDVNPGENFTQSGLVLDMHNAGVCRVVTYANKDRNDGSIGSYSKPYGGNGAYTPTTEWFHVRITRSENTYTIKVNNSTLTFETDAFNGGYLVLASVGNREVNYKNVQITSAAAPELPKNMYNGEEIPFTDWTACGIGTWKEEDCVLKPAEITEFNMLSFSKKLSENYTVDMDVKQTDTTSGWQTIQIGFEVNAGENFTQSGLVLDLHNAGVCRVVTYANKDKDDGTLGSYGNPYGGNGAYVPTTDWFHITITRAENTFTVKVNDTTLTFEVDAFNGGYLVLGSVGNREVNYKNVVITAHYHNYTVVESVEATCERDGSITYECECGASYTDTIPASGHNFVGGVCTNCGMSEGHEHDYVAGETVAPTCTEKGYTVYSCECGENYQDDFVDALGHDYVADEEDSKAPTCTEDGVNATKCSRCGDMQTEPIEALGHDYVDGICSRCGDEDPNYVKPDPCEGYIDINRDSWYHEAADFVIARGLMGSTSTDALSFEPTTVCTRSMIVMILYNIAGNPDVEYEAKFPDVPNGQWYTKAVMWAYQNGIVSGYDNGKFGPNDKVTREQMAVLLKGYAEFIGKDTSKTADLSKFPDGNKATWSKSYISWAVAEGLISGKAQNGKTYLDPQGVATRAEVAALIRGFVLNILEE